MKRIALFDFDGTITSKDTLFDISKYHLGSLRYFFKILLLIPLLALTKLGLISKQKGKESFINTVFRNVSENELNSICLKYSSRINKIVRTGAILEIKKHIASNTPVYIVSASPTNWITPWAEQFDIKVIATQLEFDKDYIKIKGNNCNYEEKVKRIKEEIDLSQFDEIFIYGDSRGDLPMLNLATHKFYKPFT